MKKRAKDQQSPQLALFAAAGDKNLISLGFEGVMQAFESQVILQTLERNGNNGAAAARELKMSRQLFHIKLGKIKARLEIVKANREGRKPPRSAARGGLQEEWEYMQESIFK